MSLARDLTCVAHKRMSSISFGAEARWADPAPLLYTGYTHEARPGLDCYVSRTMALSYLAARLVVVLAGAHLADLFAHVVGELELLLRDQLLHLGARGLNVLRLDGGLVLALGGEVRGVDVAVGQEDGHAVLRLAAHLRNV